MSHDAQQSSNSQFSRKASGINSKMPSDPFISKILAYLGLENRYLPKDTSLPSLLSELRNPDWQVRAAVVRCIGKLGGKAPLEHLVAILLQDTSSAVKATAARTLGDLADYVPLEPLLAALDDPADDVKAAAAWAVGKLGERIPSSTPLEKLLNSRHADVRAAAIRALGELGIHTPTHLLAMALEDADWQVREMASLALEEQRERTTRSELEPGSEEQGC